MKRYTKQDAEKSLLRRDTPRRRAIARFMANNGLRGAMLRQAVRNFESICRGGKP